MPGEVTLQFDEELRGLLRRREFRPSGCVVLDRMACVKDLIESVGIPHTEVGDVRIMESSVRFRAVPAPGTVVTVTAPALPLDVTRPSLLRPEPLEIVRFAVDENVERLGRLLRLAGLDAAPSGGLPDERLAARAVDEGRIVLTRDRLLLMRGSIIWGRLVRADRPWDQLAEVIRFFGLVSLMKPFSRCPVCNGILADVTPGAVWGLLEPLTKRYYHRFRRCQACGRVYWAGSHHDRARERLDRIRRDAGGHENLSF